MSQICTTVLENCNNCLEVTLINSSLIDTGITMSVGTYYEWTIDKFGNTYQDMLSITASGQTITVDTTQFPPGMFNQYAGSFDFYLTTDMAGLNVAPIIYNYTTYSCFILSIVCGSMSYSPTLFQVEQNQYNWISENGNFIQTE